MIASAGNAGLFLVSTLFDVAMLLFLLRVLLQAVRGDFFNPISQLVWRATQPFTRPLARVLPKVRRLDTASSLILVVLALIDVKVLTALLGYSIDVLDTLEDAVLKIVTMTLGLYTLTLFAQAILSWVGPGTANPVANVLWSLNEPLLRPVRRFVPPFSGLDLSPLIVMLGLQVLDRLLVLPGIFRSGLFF